MDRMNHRPRFERFKRAGKLVEGMVSTPSAEMLRTAEANGCLAEFEYLCEEFRHWLDDDAYYDDLAWNVEKESLAV